MSAPCTPPSAEEIETGRKYGAQIALSWWWISRRWTAGGAGGARINAAGR